MWVLQISVVSPDAEVVITREQFTQFFHDQVVDQLGEQLATQLVAHLCKEETAQPFDKAAAEQILKESPNLNREAAQIFTMLDTDCDTDLSEQELVSAWGQQGSLMMLSLRQYMDIEDSVSLEQWKFFWAQIARDHGTDVATQELAACKSRTPNLTAPNDSIIRALTDAENVQMEPVSSNLRLKAK